MGIPLKQFIDQFKAMEKAANETLAANPAALAGVDALPGSEHDQKVPADAKKPDEEVAQGQPAGADSTEGAVAGGDAKPCNEGKLEMDEPLLNPEKKPLVTDDALTAKTASEHLMSIVGDLVRDLRAAPAQKQASCSGECAGKACAGKACDGKACDGAKCDASAKEEKKDEQKGEEKKAQKIELDDEILSKIAAASIAFQRGREAAEKAVAEKKASAQAPAKASDHVADARAIIKAACVKAAQEQGLDQAAAEAAADNAMATAGVAPAPEAESAAPAAEAADAAGIPEDVTEEELATAIVDLVQSGELDPGTAKAIVEEIAGDDAAQPSADQAAAIIAQGLESGEITPEQAQQIAAAVEGAAAAPAAEAAAADADAAAGAADAEAAVQDAKDEAAGAADAEQAFKQAAAQFRAETLSKIASAVAAKRAEKQAAAKADAKDAPGMRVMAKVAGLLESRKAEKKAAEAKPADDAEARYIAGFRKKAEELGVDPSALARYVVANQSK